DAARPVGHVAPLSEERPCADLLPSEPSGRAAREPADVHADAHQLAHDVEARLSGLALEQSEDLGAVARQLLARPLDELRTSTHTQRVPRRLRRARTGDRSGDRFGRVDREVLDDGSARAVADDHAIAGAGENLL